MDSEEWAKQKLEHGMRPEDVKNVLADNGHDPSIVDELKSGETEESSRNNKKNFLRKGFLVSFVLVFGLATVLLVSDTGLESQDFIGPEINPLQTCEDAYEFYPTLSDRGGNETELEIIISDSNSYTELYEVYIDFDNRGDMETQELISPDRNSFRYEGHISYNGTSFVSPVDCPSASEPVRATPHIMD